MEFVNLEELRLKEDGFFDLTELKFRSIPNPKIYEYIVTEEDEMRIDLISNNLYGNSNQLDFLLWFNNIKNPFNIKRGTSIFFVDNDKISEFYTEDEDRGDGVAEDFLNAAKKTVTDKKRQKFLEEDRNVTLPPTVNERPIDPIKIENGRIIIE